MCFTDPRTNSIFRLIQYEQTVFITHVESVYCAVRTESRYEIGMFGP